MKKIREITKLRNAITSNDISQIYEFAIGKFNRLDNLRNTVLYANIKARIGYRSRIRKLPELVRT